MSYRSDAAIAPSSPVPRFDALLESCRTYVDAELRAWFASRVHAAEGVSEEVLAAAEAVQSLALRGGKRVRAALVVVGYEACSSVSVADVSELLATCRPLMLAMELLQVYLLIHDDWMDDDDVRRGGPSVHVALRERLGSQRLGDAAAILAGDLASAYAQEALLESTADERRTLAAARVFAQIQTHVVAGQLAEMSDSAGVELIHALKTASYTVTGPMAMGACLAGASESRVAQMSRYGQPLGVAFQLRDDLLGAFGDPVVTGKPVGNDVRQGKRTALVVEARKATEAQTILDRVLGREDASTEDVLEVVRMMESCGAKSRVESRVTELLSEASAALTAFDPPVSPLAHAWLSGALRALGERSS